MAYCANCGTQLSDQAPACPQCGHPRLAVGTVAAGGRTEGSAVASLVLGILGIIACPLVLSIPAVIVGLQAKRKFEEDPTLQGEGMARAGLILGWIGIGLGALGITLAVLALVLGLAGSSASFG